MKFNLGLLKASVPFCVMTEDRLLGELAELERVLETELNINIHEPVSKECIEVYMYFGVDSDKDSLFNNHISFFDQESDDEDHVTVLSWEELLNENTIPAWDGSGIPPVGTVCQAHIFGSSELVTGEVVKLRHNGEREVAAIMNLDTFEVAWSCSFYPLLVKEVSWQDEVEARFGVEYSKTNESFYFRDRTISEETFLDMCRVTLKAKGEIE